MHEDVLIIGSGEAGIQASLDLADSGISVHLVSETPSIGNDISADIAPQKLNAKLLEVIRHPNITIWTNTRIQNIAQERGYLQVDLEQNPRFIDLSRCTACGECIEVCPVTLPNQNQDSEKQRKAISIDGQPKCAAIEKAGKAPCAGTCPGGIHVQGYVALIAQRRYQEAYDLICDAIPFPSVCGRVCNHYCEAECTRGKVDEAVNIMALKRFVADWAYECRDASKPGPPKTIKDQKSVSGKKVAIIGAGPAGLTAARDLVQSGYKVTVFDSLPAAGGMMRVGIPPHRLPHELLDWEIQKILDEGVELVLNTWIDDIPGLLDDGYDAALIATGAHKAKKLPLRNSNHPDNWLSLDLLRRTCLGEDIDLSGKLAVILGGGNVALDTARTVIRLGAKEVRMVSLEPRGEMPGFAWEVIVAEEEGVEMFPGRTFKEIVLEGNKITGVRCMEVDFHGFQKGRPSFDEIPNSEHILPADLVVWAIGQEPDFSFLPHDGSIDTRFPAGIRSDENMMTTMPGVFVAGDVHRGMTFFVIDAIGEGHRAARNIDRFLRGEKSTEKPHQLSKVTYSEEESRRRFAQSNASRRARTPIKTIPLEERGNNFKEVDLTFTEVDALIESTRCLLCGICSECMACVEVCKTGAISHDQEIKQYRISCKQIVLADYTNKKKWDFDIEDNYIFNLKLNDAITGSAIAAETLVKLYSALPISKLPARKPVQGIPSRIGVFICQCGDHIQNAIDTIKISDLVKGIPGVIHAEVIPFSCSTEGTQALDNAIGYHGLDGVVLAACSCCNLDQVCYSCTYQRVRCKENLGVFSRSDRSKWSDFYHLDRAIRFEFVNIREQCAWAHADDYEYATLKARKMVEATIARLKAVPAVLASARPIEKSALILGNGPATSRCKEMLTKLGISAVKSEGVPDSIQRSAGLFKVNSGSLKQQASVLILIPQNAEINQELLLAFGRERRRPQIQQTWGGLNTSRPGVFCVDPRQDPNSAGAAVASRVFAWILRSESLPPVAAIVDPDRCRACKTCIDTCEYCAPELVEINGRYSSWIDPALCRSCGTCAAHCPSGAISAGCSTDTQLEAMLEAYLATG